MRAALFHEAGLPLAIETLPDPTPLAGEVIVRVARCGVCGTDLHATSGHGYTLEPGSQIGHEYAGEVVALGAGIERLRIGDHIAALPAVGCGSCEACRTGIDVLCPHRRRYSNGLAEFARVSERGATLLPRSLSLADGALVEPFAVGRRAVRLAAPDPSARVLIIGPGSIGLSVLFWLRQARVRAVALLGSSARRRHLAEAMGGDSFILEGEAADQQILDALGGEPDIVFECAGMPGTLSRAIDLVRPQGTILALGFCSVPDQIVPSRALMKDVQMRFSLIYTREDFAACAAALDADGDRARALVTDTVSLDEAPEAFERLRGGGGGGGKLLIDPWMNI